MAWTERMCDWALASLVAGAAIPMRVARTRSMTKLPVTLSVLNKFGVFPIRRHYYEPLYDASSLNMENNVRDLPGIDFNVDPQLDLLKQFGRIELPGNIPLDTVEDNQFYYRNRNFEFGDADVWFYVIRHFKPRRIIEVGSGHSTKMARLAIAAARSEDPTYRCEHICIEPYEMPWLEDIGVRVIRKKLEDCDLSIMAALDENDILFIDSSHMIRPQGDVIVEILQILPKLTKGVIVHVHDIFSPRDYPMEWLRFPFFWNEQYLLEAFLTQNDEWDVLLAVNLLQHEHHERLKALCPRLERRHNPGSFYIRRR